MVRQQLGGNHLGSCAFLVELLRWLQRHKSFELRQFLVLRTLLCNGRAASLGAFALIVWNLAQQVEIPFSQRVIDGGKSRVFLGAECAWLASRRFEMLSNVGAHWVVGAQQVERSFWLVWFGFLLQRRNVRRLRNTAGAPAPTPTGLGGGDMRVVLAALRGGACRVSGRSLGLGLCGAHIDGSLTHFGRFGVGGGRERAGQHLLVPDMLALTLSVLRETLVVLQLQQVEDVVELV